MAATLAGAACRQKSFKVNGVEVQTGVLPRLPLTHRELKEVVGLSGKVVVTVTILKADGTFEYHATLQDRVEDFAAFWFKAYDEPGKSVNVSVAQTGQDLQDACARSFKRLLAPALLPLLCAILLPGSGLVPREVEATASYIRHAATSFPAGPRLETPKDQMTKFAVANVKGSTKESDASGFLNNFLMEDTRSYIKTVIFETTASHKQDNVVNALSNTNLPHNVTTKIGLLVANTTLLVDQFSDFHYGSDGRAYSYSVNVWASREKADKTLDVALMVSGASFKKSDFNGVEEIEEPQVVKVWNFHPATWYSSEWTEYVERPLLDEHGKQVVRKTTRPVFNNASAVKPHEIEILRNQLLTWTCFDALKNHAPDHLQALTAPRLVIPPRVAGGHPAREAGDEGPPAGEQREAEP
ncbi:unnamed protein product [Prorocentrum cordatum]|uniref:Uncharacterized protein n=1 Tax=Prorocentrum cordatum TaxID=2364126 RepID=A0ABN9SFQ4_9DINO|nr:unnamed protein product [Polarella glacialis]